MVLQGAHSLSLLGYDVVRRRRDGLTPHRKGGLSSAIFLAKRKNWSTFPAITIRCPSWDAWYMTIAVAWIRRNKDAVELLVASDSRLRSRGALDQCQKIFRLERGDCCLAFSGDAQIAYPLFMQIGSAINNNVRTRTRATDVTNMADLIKGLLNNLIKSWDLSKTEKNEELALTRIMFAGWSWRHKRFDIGIFVYRDGSFAFDHKTTIPHPWAENDRSLVFTGDYQQEYMNSLASVLESRHGHHATKGPKKFIDFDYEPAEALQALLNKEGKTLTAIGGACQLLKLYPFSNSLPIIIRTGKHRHFLLGRRLFSWEKTEYPILDLRKERPTFIYPMSNIPVPSKLKAKATTIEEDIPPI
jgi:hypothetical protein